MSFLIFPGFFTEKGFTLIELLAGIAIISLLLLGVFQFLTDIIRLRTMIQNEGLKKHRVVSFTKLLHQDLMAIPRGKRNFVAQRNKFLRTTVSYESSEAKLLDTRVRYRILEEDGQEVLYRSWKWLDIHRQFQESQEMVRAEDIELRYRTDDGNWVKSIARESIKVRAVEVKWSKQRLVIPVASDARKI